MQLRKTPISPPAPETATAASAGTANIDALGDLPHSYGSDTIFLVAQEPRWLFTYWDIDISRHPGGPSALRVYEGETVESEIEVPFETRNWYIPVQVPGGSYTVEIGFYRHEHWNVIARSGPAQTPPDRLSESDAFSYASIPLHLNFQRLIDTLQEDRREGEPLSETMGRLQREGRFFPPDSPLAPALSPFERNFLETLLGKNVLENLSSQTLGSEDLAARIREHLQERLSSADSSSFWASLPAGSSDLLGRDLSSWSLDQLSSWAAGAITSGSAPALRQASSSFGSWMQAAGGLSSAEITSAGAASSAISSWPGPTSTAREWAASSWAQAAVTSWPGLAASSWGSSGLSSWGESSGSSWGGASDTFSSPAGGRDFFMNVNAEVIIYGGTDPRAHLTIDGKSVALNPDGTFRSHFIFPNGAYEIPIVATSPDGVETRSATLRFDRATGKIGQVDDTAQPPFSPPPGGKF